MIKKICVLLAVVCTLAFTLTGCSESVPSSFEGNYKEPTKAELQNFTAQVDQAEELSEVDLIKKGVEIKYLMDMQASMGGESESMKSEITFKSVLEDNKVKAAGSVSIDGLGISSLGADSVEFWYADGYEYVKAGNSKAKIELPVDEFIDEYIDEVFDAMSSNDFASLVEQLDELKSDDFTIEDMPGMQVKVDKAELTIDSSDANQLKVKVEMKYGGDLSQSYMGQTMSAKYSCNAEIYYVFNQNYQLISTYLNTDIDMVMDMGTGDIDSKTKLQMYVIPYTGTIELPSDLASYTE